MNKKKFNYRVQGFLIGVNAIFVYIFYAAKDFKAMYIVMGFLIAMIIGFYLSDKFDNKEKSK